MRAHRLALLVVSPVFVPAAAAMAQDPPPPPLIARGDITVGLRTVQNLANYPTPIDLTHAGDGSNRIFIATQNGHVFVYPKGGAAFPQQFLNISPGSGSALSLITSGERGLLGMAFHPDFATQGAAGFGKFYTYTSESKGSNLADFTHPEIGSAGGDHHSVLREWTVDPANPNRIDTSVPSDVLMRIAQPQSNHNGGSIKFGPDKNLYIAMGDGGGGNDNGGSFTNNTDGHTNNTGNGQDLSNVFGKVLRIDPLGTNGKTGKYGIPADNPYANDPAHDTKMVFAHGLRNPFRTSFDRVTGTYYVGDVGQGNREEVSIVEKGKNYGWVYKEGTRTNVTPPQGSGPFEPPIAEYINNNAAGPGDGNAVIGGFVYRGTKVPDLYGKYVFGDLAGNAGTGRLFYTEPTAPAPGTLNEIEEFNYFTGTNVGAPTGQLYAFGEDQDGELYATFTGGPVRILLAQAWGRDGGGSWNTATNWIGPVPNGAGHVANFLTELVTPANAPATITLDGNKTVGTLRFNNTVTNGVNPNSYIISQGTGGTLSILGGGGTPPGIEVLAGTHTIAAPVALSTSTINVADGSTLSFTNDVGFLAGALHNITKAGGGTVNISTPFDLGGNALNVSQGTFSVPNYLIGGDVTVQPGATLLAGQVGLKTLLVRGAADVDKVTEVGSPTALFSSVSVQGPDAANPATLRSAGIRADQLSIGHGKLTIKPSGANVDTTVIGSLNMTQDGSTLDLTDNDLILHANAGGPTYYAAMRMLVQDARNSSLGRWKGPGITSSAAAENPLTGLALVLNSRSVNGEPEPIFTNVSGEPTVLNDVIVKYTYNGDANLDGRINADDYFRIDQGFLAGGPGTWTSGDFNYDGNINADDYFLIDQAFLGQGQPLTGISGALAAVSVPEPASLVLCLSPLFLLTRRRARTR